MFKRLDVCNKSVFNIIFKTPILYFNEINKMIISKFKKYTLPIIFVNFHLDFLANIYLDTISLLVKIKRRKRVRG